MTETGSALDLVELRERTAAALRRSHDRVALGELHRAPSGASSLTFFAEAQGGDLDGRAVVVKVAPPGLEPVRNRDVLRQARLLRALAGAEGVRVPEVLGDDGGVPPEVPPLFVMGRVEGESYEPNLEVDPSGLPGAAEVEQRARHAARMLAALHAVDPTAAGLGDESQVSLAAEVRRWIRAFETIDDAMKPGAEECGRRLLAGIPRPLPPALIHGDFRLGNTLCAGGEVMAVIDWEIWSRSDPRIDLAWFLLTADPAAHTAAVRSAPGMPSREELLAEYEQASGGPVPDLGWFDALIQFKMAATTALLIKHNRRLRQPDPRRESHAARVPVMIERAAAILDGLEGAASGAGDLDLRRDPPAVAAGLADRRSWWEPGIYEVVPGLFRVPLPLRGDALRAVNVYLLVDGGGVSIIDSGTYHPESWDWMTAALRGVGAGIGDLRDVLVTHVHYDHLGQAAVLRRAGGARILLGAGEEPSVARMLSGSVAAADRPVAWGLRLHGGDDIAEAMRDGRLRANPAPRGTWELPDVFAGDGLRVEVGGTELQAVETPGHTVGHLSFLDGGRRLLFGGDHVLPHITPSIGFELPLGRLPLGHFLASLARIRDLPVDLVLPAHGPTFTDLAGRVDELVQHHALRLDQAAEAVRSGSTRAIEVANQLTWTRRHTAFADLDVYNQRLALLETVAHLDLLVAWGRLRSEKRDGVMHYQELQP